MVHCNKLGGEQYSKEGAAGTRGAEEGQECTEGAAGTRKNIVVAEGLEWKGKGEEARGRLHTREYWKRGAEEGQECTEVLGVHHGQ